MEFIKLFQKEECIAPYNSDTIVRESFNFWWITIWEYKK